MPATTCRRIRPELWAAGLLFAAFLGLFSGCGPSEADATASEAVQETAPGFVRSQPQLTRWTPEAPDLTPLTVQAEGEPAGQAPIKNAAKEDARADAPGAAKAPPNRTTRAGPPHTGATEARTAREPVRWTPRLAGPSSASPGRAAERVTEPPEAAAAAPEGGESRAAAGQDITLPNGARGRAPILPGDTLVRVTRADERVRTRVDARVAADRPEAPRGAVSARPERATPRAVGEGRVARSTARLSHPMLGEREIELGDDLARLSPRSVVSPRAAVAGDDPDEWRTGRGWAPAGEDDDRGDYLSSAEEFEVLVPGSGWSGSTQQPPPVGNDSMPGFDAKAIARWDVVPFQTITEDFHIGVVAFHINGIDRVEFSVNGGPWSRVPRMQLNPRTNVWEYTVVIRPELFEEDGPIEVRAIVWPKSAGVPRVLAGEIENSAEFRNGNHSMLLSVNANGTLPEPKAWADAANGSDTTGVVGDPNKPFRTPFRALHVITQEYGSADGATVYLRAGDYTWGREEYMTSPVTSTRWATLRPAAGVSRDSVRFNAQTTGGFRTQLVSAQGVSFDSQSQLYGPGGDAVLWLDRASFNGGSSFWAGSWYWGIYVTRTSFVDVGHAVVSASLARGVTINGIDNDAFPGGLFVINSLVRGQDAQGTNHHSDIWQARPGYEENIVLYGVTVFDAKEQGFFTRGNSHRDVAIVNCSLSLQGYPNQNQFIAPFQHLLVWHNTFAGTPFTIGVSDSRNDYGYYESRNAAWSNNIFQWMSLSDPQSFSGSTDPHEDDLVGTTFLSNHFYNVWPDYHDNGGNPIGRPYGDDATEGPVAPPDRGAYGSGTPPWVQDQPR